MAKGKGAKRGPKKGSTKRFKRPFADGFPQRFRLAMGHGLYISDQGRSMNTALARKVGCRHATIGQYLNGKKQTMDALLMLELCDELSVSPYYLALNQGSVEDVQADKIPMQEIRKKQKTPRRRRRMPSETN